MTQYRSLRTLPPRNPGLPGIAPGIAAAAIIALLASATSVQAGPFSASESVAIPGGGNSNFAQLKQISGFTGLMGFGYSDGAYNLVGQTFNKLISLRFTVDCPANYRVHEAGIRVEGADVYNYTVELVSPGDVPFDQNSWQQVLEQEPWDFDAVQQTGIDALSAADNIGPVYVSLDKVLDSRTEFYASCSPSQPSSGLPFLYYDSAEDNGHMRPMTRVRYSLQYSAEAAPQARFQLPAAGQPRAPGLAERLRHRERAVSQVPAKRPTVLVAPGGCPYDCPPPLLKLRKQR